MFSSSDNISRFLCYYVTRYAYILINVELYLKKEFGSFTKRKPLFCNLLCRLREWVARAAEREREREQRRRERWERRRAEPKHHFDNPDYEKQKMKVAESLEDALQQGLSDVL